MTSTDHTSSAEVIAALEEVYTRIKRVTREIRTSDRIVADLGVDSLATLEMLLELEKRFDVSLVDDPGAARVETVGDLVALLDAARSGRAGRP
ncbi:acyl carrier protein [Saccharothrix sp. NPDC042600]|uniref:acyl carrier protein n=1 Tax=Saccharothrix TaxID=2071 RepID=UPI0033E73EB8|nr:hypothetical protein GCM10017745_58280 [Saccharothrix mutabilis subsp. capreolus]